MIQVVEVNVGGHAYARCGCSWKTGIFASSEFVEILGENHHGHSGHAWTYPKILRFTPEHPDAEEYPTFAESDRRELM